jgi:hypothetical protein
VWREGLETGRQMMDSEEEGGEANSSIYSHFLALHLFFGFITLFYFSVLKGLHHQINIAYVDMYG